MLRKRIPPPSRLPSRSDKLLTHGRVRFTISSVHFRSPHGSGPSPLDRAVRGNRSNSRMLVRFALLALCSLLVAGCLPASRGTISPERGSAGARRTLEASYASPALDYDRRSVLQAAERWLGTPYRYGGSSQSGVDCSAFVQAVYNTVNYRLPRTSAEQAGIGETVDLREAQPGDLLFFNTSGGGVSHVGILVGGDQFVHASTSSGVTVSSLNEAYYNRHFLYVRRVLR